MNVKKVLIIFLLMFMCSACNTAKLCEIIPNKTERNTCIVISRALFDNTSHALLLSLEDPKFLAAAMTQLASGGVFSPATITLIMIYSRHYLALTRDDELLHNALRDNWRSLTGRDNLSHISYWHDDLSSPHQARVQSLAKRVHLHMQAKLMHQEALAYSSNKALDVSPTPLNVETNRVLGLIKKGLLR